jgi:hypothetical protein
MDLPFQIHDRLSASAATHFLMVTFHPSAYSGEGRPTSASFVGTDLIPIDFSVFGYLKDTLR